MIKISVVSYNNEIPSAAPSAVFDREGRTFGRSKDNYFVLDDPKNLVSRTQASVKSDGVRHTITNLSRATPILVNGREIDADREYDLQFGDELQIGLYLLRAEAVIRSAPAVNGASATPGQPVPGPAVVSQMRPEPAVTAGPGSSASASAMQRPLIDAVAPSAAPTPASVQADVQPAVQPAPVAAPSADHQALIQAFLSGAGIPSVTLSQGLTPEFMETVGKLLAVSVQGTMDLNALRALVKREVKADVTQVVVRNNNPLKFLPDGETVLTQMFRKKMPGFMSPAEAMEDAFEDLHAHQLAVVEGMRAAMVDMLKRMHPETLEGKVKEQSLLGSMLPANRKAKLWDSYTELFGKINGEAQDDSQALFSQAFLEAYEQEIERVKNHAQNP
jgi:FHA domain-containing protein